MEEAGALGAYGVIDESPAQSTPGPTVAEAYGSIEEGEGAAQGGASSSGAADTPAGVVGAATYEPLIEAEAGGPDA